MQSVVEKSLKEQRGATGQELTGKPVRKGEVGGGGDSQAQRPCGQRSREASEAQLKGYHWRGLRAARPGSQGRVEGWSQ